jgi:hypothetical protein
MRLIYFVVLALGVSVNAQALDLGDLSGDLLKNLKGGTGKDSIAAPSTSSKSGIDRLSDGDVVKGLKEALNQGAASAVSKLGKENGFLGNEKVKIPLPATLQKVEQVMRTMGQGKVFDELVVTMNRAAEAAVPQAKTLLLDAIKKMSVQDAKAILTGGDDAATQYFRKTTESQLHDRFLPIVSKSVGKLRVAEKYNTVAGKASQFGLVDEKQANMQEYVTQKSLDGLFLMVGEEERAIRKDPVQRTGYWAKKVFGALGQ